MIKIAINICVLCSRIVRAMRRGVCGSDDDLLGHRPNHNNNNIALNSPWYFRPHIYAYITYTGWTRDTHIDIDADKQQLELSIYLSFFLVLINNWLCVN